jgi:hypothetical protein
MQRNRQCDHTLPLFFAVALALLAPSLRSQPTVSATQPHGDPGSRFVLAAFPDTDLYPEAITDPLRAQSAIILASFLDTEIPESGDSRFILRLGGTFPLVRVHPAGHPDRGFQLDFKGGFFGHFDADHSLDNIGWDGLYGLVLSWRPDADLAFRFGTLHDSAHVGDEYAERTGRTRIGYTRQEWVAGVSWIAAPRWRVYAEGGYGFGLDEFQEPSRLQLGVETTGQRRFWNERARWYAALDLGAREEWDWERRVTSQAGIMIDTGRGTQRYRLALEYGDGRSSLGEFILHEESYLSLGWYFDF